VGKGSLGARKDTHEGKNEGEFYNNLTQARGHKGYGSYFRLLRRLEKAMNIHIFIINHIIVH
jgi:hypothetical protein